MKAFRLLERIFFLILLILSTSLGHSISQNYGQWAWMKGDTTAFPLPVFGTRGVPNIANTPPGLYEANEFTDLQGNFWIYGGNTNFGLTSALWRYTPANNMWTWMSGSTATNVPPTFGVRGVPSPTSFPGSRGYGAVTWTDLNGNLWLFGGVTYINGDERVINDLWKYDISTNQWTWMKGDSIANSPGNFGTRGVPANSNNPPSRAEEACSWVDENGDLWTFGGIGVNSLTDDMWRYSPANNMWTWMSGSDTGNIAVNYGTRGVPHPNNTPGARCAYGHWKDTQGNFWIYGGFNNGIYGDLWKYNKTTLLWTWMNGTDSINATDGFTQKCVYGSERPHNATENRSVWTDNCGRFWQFGSDLGSGNEFWVYDPGVDKFSWIGGDTSFAEESQNYGTRGVLSSNNYPYGVSGGVGFTSSDGNFWLFGGAQSMGFSNCLWKFIPDTTCPSIVSQSVAIISSQAVACSAQPVTVEASINQPGLNYHWDFGVQSTNADTANTPMATFAYSTPGTYTVTLVVRGRTGCLLINDTSSYQVTITPITSVNLGSDRAICGNGASLTLSAGAGSSWLWNTGATSQTLVVNTPGTYSVTANPGSPCPSRDTILISQIPATDLGPDTSICQGNTYTLNAGPSGNCLWSTGTNTQSITINSSGTYSVTVNNQNCQFKDTAVVTVLPRPNISLGTDRFICPGQVVLLDAGNPGAQYLWSTAQTTQTIQATIRGRYFVRVNYGTCTNTDTINLLAATAPAVNLGRDTTLVQPIVFTLDAGPALDWLWNTGEITQTIEVTEPGTYYVRISSPEGCLAADTIRISSRESNSFTESPNIFTPNNDGLNDVFVIKINDIRSIQIELFDRWGKKVFEQNYSGIPASKTAFEVWDGKAKDGAVLPDGVYYFIVNAVGNDNMNHPSNGFVHLLRGK